MPGATLWDIISATPELSRFRDAISGSGTEDLFESTDDEYTVLAPVNDAFTGQSGSFDVNDYLIPGRMTAAEIFANDEIDVESGATLAVVDAAQTVGGAVMTSSRDVDAANGYIDVIRSFVTPT
ncbi:MAG: fasciclin domain-containing protein [Ilumatobacteraceae bacterium]